MRILVPLFAISIVLVVTALSAPSAPLQEEVRPAQPFKPAAPHERLMEWHEETYGQLNTGIARRDRERAIRNAWLLAELANVNEQHRDDPRYRTLAAEMREGAKRLAEVLDAEDYEQARKLSTEMNRTCKACHDAFGH